MLGCSYIKIWFKQFLFFKAFLLYFFLIRSKVTINKNIFYDLLRSYYYRRNMLFIYLLDHFDLTYPYSWTALTCTFVLIVRIFLFNSLQNLKCKQINNYFKS